MAPRKRRSSSIWTLLLVAVSLFVGGVLALYARSDSGQLFLARHGVVLSRAEVTQSLSRTVKTALRRLGVPTAAQSVETVDRESGPRVRWEVALPPRASLMQVNAALSQAVEMRGGRVFDAWEEADREAGTRVTITLGIGRLRTHEVVLVRRADAEGAEVARIALVLEGFGREEVDSLAAVATHAAYEFAGAVLTNRGRARHWADRLAGAGREVVALVPMEPMNYPTRSPGKDAILVDMSSGRVRRLVRKHLSAARRPVAYLPYMGGMALQDLTVMEAVMVELKRKGIAYLEPGSRRGSVGLDAAAASSVPFLRLDSEINPRVKGVRRQRREIRRRLEEVADTARRRGFAACTARLDAVLLELLESEVPKLEKQGVRFVALSSLLRPSAI